MSGIGKGGIQMKKSYEYIGVRGKNCEIVTLDGDFSWYDVRKDEEELPRVGAWCKHCAQESAKPMYAIWMNGKPGYALRCEKCGSEYAMYKSMYNQRYIGTHYGDKGFVRPTHGVISYNNAMDRKAREIKASLPQRVEDSICEMLHMSHEEYRDMKKRQEVENQKAHKRYERERAEFHSQFVDDQIKRESERRKELIQKGVLKYVKGVGLVNTETNKVVKL